MRTVARVLPAALPAHAQYRALACCGAIEKPSFEYMRQFPNLGASGSGAGSSPVVVLVLFAVLCGLSWLASCSQENKAMAKNHRDQSCVGFKRRISRVVASVTRPVSHVLLSIWAIGTSIAAQAWQPFLFH